MSDISIGAAVGVRDAKLQTELSLAVLRQSNTLDQLLVETLSKAVEAAPSPGTGRVLDRRV